MQAVRPGDLLISQVTLTDGIFDESVLLVLDADHTGALAVILNQMSHHSLGVLPGWEELVSEPRIMFSGGPVSPNGAICLASISSEEEPPGWRRVFDNVGLLHLDTPIELVRGAFDDMRIFAGYAGWEPGQLEREIAEDMWFVARGRYDDVFGAAPEGLWRSTLRRQPPEVAIYATWTDDSEWN